jgi:ArsR family transcriptional regulator
MMGQTDGICSQDILHDCVQGAEARQALIDLEAAERLARIFRSLADPTRLRIVSALARSELCVGDLSAVLGMSVSAVSHQLRLLREMRVVRNRREGKHVYYVLDDEHVGDLFRQGLEHVSHE